jgi:uncharacterized phiE125 gp8 family phage protein
VNLVTLVEPAVEPVTLAEAKAHLRVDSSDEDSTISMLITAARIHVERYTRRSLVYTAHRLLLDAWPHDIELPRSPAVVAAANTVTGIAYATPRIRYYDENGVQQTLTYAAQDFDALVNDNPPRLVLYPDTTWPSLQTALRGGIEIDWIAGYGAAAASVPAPLKLVIRMLVSHWFELREAVAPGTMSTVPMAVESILMAYQDGSLG